MKSIPSNKLSTSMYACGVDDNVRFARSQAVRKRRTARSLDVGSFPGFFRLNSINKCSTTLLSKSSPPKCVSPAVALTWTKKNSAQF